MRCIGYVLLAWALILTESNGGVLAVGAAIFFLLLLRSYRKRGLVGSLATALVIVLAVGGLLAAFPISKVRQDALNSGQPLLVNSIGRSGQSTSERGELDKELIQLYNRSDGFLGLGPMSTKPVLQAGLYPYPNEAHNDFLAALTERGAIGLLGLLLLTGTVIWWAAPLVRRPLSAGYAAVVPRPAGLVAALLALAAISYYEEVLHFRFLWALFGIVAILGKDARR
jgi:O-antigen ligase